MFQLRQILYFFMISLAWLARPALAAPPLTQIQDVLYRADGVPFSGAVTITWRSFVASDTTSIPANVLTVQVTDGVLRLQLVPTTNASAGAYYAVRFTVDGRTQFSETWAVPPSAAPVGLKDIRVAAVPGGGTTVGGGGGSTGTVLLGDVVGLAEALNDRPQKGPAFAINRIALINNLGRLVGVGGLATDCVRVDGSTGACGSGGGTAIGFIDMETPAGVINGVNSVFTLGQAPSPAGSLHLFRNGILQKAGTDYSLSGNGVTFLAVSIPQAGDALTASYRMGGL
ncbi:MAG TPA: hypothetical protein VGK29_07875 [Paludibaculum sp.]|jgi:hypothetical protein